MLGFIFSLLVGALAGYIAGRIMGSETSTLRNIVLGILGSFVGEFLFGLIGIHATGTRYNCQGAENKKALPEGRAKTNNQRRPFNDRGTVGYPPRCRRRHPAQR